MANFSSESEGESFEVDRIVDSRKRGRNVEYLVRWKGFGEVEDSWEPAKNLKRSSDIIKAFEESSKTPARRKSSSRKVEEKVTQSGRNVTRTVVTKTETRTISGNQSEASSPESSPVLRRRQTTKTEVTKVISDSPKKVSRSKIGDGILDMTGMDFPIIILVVCFLFIALTFIIQLK